jgi:hypothetical protein
MHGATESAACDYYLIMMMPLQKQESQGIFGISISPAEYCHIWVFLVVLVFSCFCKGIIMIR